MVRLQLDERQWKKLEAILASEQGAGRPGKNDRNFIEAVGACKTVFNRFDRCAKNGRWERVLEGLQTDRDNEWHSIDSTINRAHPHAAGGKGGAAEQGLGRSRGGLSTKVHWVVDALGLPITFEITEGQRPTRCAKTISLPVLCPVTSSSPSRTQTSNNAADSVAEPLAVK